MKHDWILRPATREHFGKEPQRTCSHCGATQDQVVETAWGRIIGRTWKPRVGRCPGKKTKK